MTQDGQPTGAKDKVPDLTSYPPTEQRGSHVTSAAGRIDVPPACGVLGRRASLPRGFQVG